MMLYVGNIAYNDATISFSQWPEHKASLDICPLGQLPTLQLPSGEVIAQSGAITRFVAKLVALYPQDHVEAARADMIHEMAQDMNAINAILNFWPRHGEAFEQNKESYFRNLNRYAMYAERLLGEKYYFGGSQPHYGDFSLFHIFDISLAVDSSCLNAFGKLQRWVSAMQNIPRVKQYLQQRELIGNLGMCGSLIQTIVPMTDPAFLELHGPDGRK
jgi:glutathione S-transferase